MDWVCSGRRGGGGGGSPLDPLPPSPGKSLPPPPPELVAAAGETNGPLWVCVSLGLLAAVHRQTALLWQAVMRRCGVSVARRRWTACHRWVSRWGQGGLVCGRCLAHGCRGGSLVRVCHGWCVVVGGRVVRQGASLVAPGCASGAPEVGPLLADNTGATYGEDGGRASRCPWVDVFRLRCVAALLQGGAAEIYVPAQHNSGSQSPVAMVQARSDARAK